MRLHRFFVSENLNRVKEIRITDEKLLHQMRDVFRLKSGDEVVLFLGDSTNYRCKINVLSKKEGVFEKISEEKGFVPEIKVALLMAVIKKENFELVCEKATEIGVSTIVPIVTERTLAKNLNTERLQKIIIEASEQCGRGDIPELKQITNLELAITSYSNIIAFDISGTSSLPSFSTSSLLIGPEGGWSDGELELIKSKGIKLAKLGDTTLRAETAAIVACAKVMGI